MANGTGTYSSRIVQKRAGPRRRSLQKDTLDDKQEDDTDRIKTLFDWSSRACQGDERCNDLELAMLADETRSTRHLPVEEDAVVRLWLCATASSLLSVPISPVSS